MAVRALLEAATAKAGRHLRVLPRSRLQVSFMGLEWADRAGGGRGGAHVGHAQGRGAAACLAGRAG